MDTYPHKHFFHIGYHGWNYRGWQRQAGITSVQETIETAISKILKRPVTIYGCGRTDAQVSASQYFFHIEEKLESDYDLMFRLNKVLPQDIAVFDILQMDGSCHARYDAAQRTYDYFIHSYKDPFLNTMSAYYNLKGLDFDKMKKAVALLTKYNDYYGFCRSPEKNESTVCVISSAKLLFDSTGDKFRFTITANRFLKAMIRILIGKILEVGRGEFSLEEFENCFINRRTPQLIIPAHPHGLYLSKIKYPYLDLKPRMDFSGILQNRVDDVWVEV
jgi:tRNA pseudouridine38-40 synthase